MPRGMHRGAPGACGPDCTFCEPHLDGERVESSAAQKLPNLLPDMLRLIPHVDLVSAHEVSDPL
jgi:hypothetical protein